MSKKYGYPIKRKTFNDKAPRMAEAIKVEKTKVMKGQGGTEYFPHQDLPKKGEGGTQNLKPNTPSYINKSGRGGTSKNY